MPTAEARFPVTSRAPKRWLAVYLVFVAFVIVYTLAFNRALVPTAAVIVIILLVYLPRLFKGTEVTADSVRVRDKSYRSRTIHRVEIRNVSQLASVSPVRMELRDGELIVLPGVAGGDLPTIRTLLGLDGVALSRDTTPSAATDETS